MFMRYHLSKVGHMDGSSTTLSGDNNLTKDFKEYQKCFSALIGKGQFTKRNERKHLVRTDMLKLD